MIMPYPLSLTLASVFDWQAIGNALSRKGFYVGHRTQHSTVCHQEAIKHIEANNLMESFYDFRLDALPGGAGAPKKLPPKLAQ